jgi:hypothetical protein
MYKKESKLLEKSVDPSKSITANFEHKEHDVYIPDIRHF